MFNLPHILYIIISGVITAALLFVSVRFVRTEIGRVRILKLSAVVTVLIHYSNLVVDFFKNGGTAVIEDNHILPVYPCNVIMWMLLIFAFIENKRGILARLIGEYCCIVGTVCAFAGVVLNANYGINPTLLDFGIFKGLLSHSTMLFGCVYIGFLGYVKFGMFNMLSLSAGFSVFMMSGLLVDGLYTAFGMEVRDGMFMRGVPYIGLSSALLGAIILAIAFCVYALIELRLPKEERWYSKLRALICKKHDPK